MPPRWVLWLVLAVPAAAGPAAAAEYYVSNSGDDGHPGDSPSCPWRTIAKVNGFSLSPGDTVRFQRGGVWRGQLEPRSGSEKASVTYTAYGEGPKPLLLGSVELNRRGDWQPAGSSLWRAGPFACDVGNIIFDDGKVCGIKVWREADVNAAHKFWYDPKQRTVLLYSQRPPAETHADIECALARHIISQGGKSHVVYDGLHLAYGACHGIGGGGTHHIVVRHCDLCFIGGGHQHTTPGGHHVRFGNGIEFWDGAHDNLVEHCRIWDIYDAGLTNQGGSQNAQYNITYRKNVIWNCEYSFEYWNRPGTSTTRDICFEDNLCVNAGHGWSNAQRPWRAGVHLMFFSNSAQTSRFIVRRNVFHEAKHSTINLDAAHWNGLEGLTLEDNLYCQPAGALLVGWGPTTYKPADFATYQQRTGKDSRSVLAALKDLAASPARMELQAGQARLLRIAGTYSNGMTADVTDVARLASSADTVALVEPGGIVRAGRPGKADVTASFDGLTAAAVIEVAPRPDSNPPPAVAPLDAKEARRIQEQWARRLGEPVVRTNSVGMKLVLLPPGEFTMGRTEEQLEALLKLVKSNPKTKANYGGQVVWSMLMMPGHRVRLTQPFCMGATEVTVGQFRRFVEASGYRTEAEQGLNGGEPMKAGQPICTWRKPMVWINLQQKDDEPVLHLCWNDCVAFCDWLGKKEGQEYGLPTEAQWEYACRAGAATPWHFGDYQDVPRVAHEYAFWSEGPQGKHDRPRSVAQGKPNAFGLYDMHGNVWEYVADWWHRMYYKESPLNDPAGPETQDELNRLRRIIRGSSFDWDSLGGDAAYRMRIGQRSTQHPHMGFRVAMRLKGVPGAPPAVDPREKERAARRDPGANSQEVRSALERGAVKGALPNQRTIDLGAGAKMEFVLVPAGSFLMGSNNGPNDERPVHRVVISKPFYMARHELTQGQWEAVMGKHEWLEELRAGKAVDAVGPGKAMNALSRAACEEYLRRLGAKVPKTAFALPTEAQWEYACRAGSAAEFSFGDDAAALGEHAWFHGNMDWVGHPGFRGKLFYHDAGAKKPNAFGLYDMHGGVWEWCADRYDPDYYLASPLVDPKGPPRGTFGVLRGGSWFRYAKYARSAYRKFFHPDGDGDATTAYINDFGCRLVINLDGDASGRPASAPPNREVSGPAGKPGTGPDRTGDYVRLARSLVRSPLNPVLKVGEKGAWNDQTWGCFTVLADGNTFYLYSEGARYGKEKRIGVATSSDGVHWTCCGKNPLFAGGMPHAIKVGQAFRLYYCDAGGLQMRTAPDGLQWSEPKRVMDGVLDPCVVRVGENRFHLYYCAGGQKTVEGKQVWEFKNYLATSPDGIAWRKQPEPVLPLGREGSWEAQSHAGPCVLKLADGFHLWYLGSGPYQGKTAWRIGHATSPDGLKWTRSGPAPVLDVGKAGEWDGGTLMHFDIALRDGKFLFWYAAAPTGHEDETKMTIQIGHGTSP